MALPLDSIINKGGGYWTLAWTDTGNGPYRIVLDGLQIGTTEDTTFDVLHRSSTIPPSIEVEEDGVRAASELYPPLVSIQWYQVPGAVGYIVERNLGGVWGRVGSVNETGESVYRHEEPASDGEQVQLRVSAEDAFGNRSSPLYYSTKLLAVPASPEAGLQVAYLAGNITIGAA